MSLNHSPQGVNLPIYEYYCQACGDFEKLQSYEGRGLVSCPDCGAKVKRKMSLFSFKLYNPFTKDGKGFETKYMSRQEARERAKANVGYEE